ncbi:sigma-70 family RNA polymerase sigma factor [Peribacillus kribbensis]|uniref:sigma-70 family RNA polymerase sigma factor n=1 Tax=Peribacillus kribbensis TaxID=356658 RepID=UPI0004260214|nr:sigma-70 family RNA polymerase sigma factor [Peribacillus kribbensis]
MQVKKMTKHSSPDEIHHLPREEQLVWLMGEYGDMIIRLAFTYVKQKQVAEDISQEVFISCYQSLDRFENRSAYKTWLYRITVNKCKDYLDSWSFKHIFYKDFFSSLLTKGAVFTENKLLDQENKEGIFKKVLALPVKLREVIILHYYEELSIKEIAGLLNLNANTVKTRLHRGRQQLKGFFEGGEAE